jgi:hypothetical protein
MHEGKTIFAAPPSGISSQGAQRHYRAPAANVPLKVAGKNYNFYYIPEAVECTYEEWDIPACPEPGYTQQKVYANYVHHAIQDIKAGTLVDVRPLALNKQFADLKAQLVEIQNAYQNQSTSARSRLETAIRLIDLLRKLAENRSAYRALGREDASPEEYLQRAREVEQRLHELEQQARKEEAEELRQTLRREMAQASQLKAELQGPAPASLAEWQARMEGVGRYKEALGRQRALVTSLRDLGEPVPPEEMGELEQNLRWAADTERELALAREGLELGTLEADYRAMQQERRRLEDRYTRAFNTPQERPAQEALLAHLRRMLENRMAAERTGGEAAAKQAEQLRKEIDKWSRR